MKNVKRILVLIIVAIMFIITTVNAADATANLKLSSEKVKPGDTFTVTLNVSCNEGINGLQAKLSYDDTNLQLIKTEMADSKWVNLGDELNFEIIYNDSNTEATSADIIKATFKVNEESQIGTKAEITMSNIKVDSNESTNSMKDLGTKKVEVSIEDNQTLDPVVISPDKTLESISITTAPTRTTYTAGENFDKTGMVVTANYGDGSSKEVTNYTITDGTNLTEGKTSVTISYTEGSITKTATQNITVVKESSSSSNNNTATQNNTTVTIPYTGGNSMFSIIGILAIVTVVFYIRYNKYKNI